MSPSQVSRTRYRFGDFVLSPSRRILLRRGDEVRLIPRYFDLLVLLVERRNEAVSKEEIFDAVWSDVIVSDGALTQAVRTLRKSLGDRPKNPVFIKTMSRHGYRFIFGDITEEPDEEPIDTTAGWEASAPKVNDANGALDEAMERLLRTHADVDEEEEDELREAARTVLRLGGEEALEKLGESHDVARALLRDARWDLPDAGPVPLRSARTVLALVRLRLRHALRLVGRRWMGATLGGASAGLVGGLLGGLVLRFGPGSAATSGVLIALPLVGIAVGGLGAAGVGAGLGAAEALVRSFRRLALVVLGSAGGGAVGALSHLVARFGIESLFGRDLSPVGGGFEGIVLGAAAGAGYALATPVREGGMAAPRGRPRLIAALVTGASCAAACFGLAATDHYLGAMSLDFLAQTFPGSQVSLDPLARLLGEEHPGFVTRVFIGSSEGLLFGVGLALGLTHRPRRRQT